MAVRTITIDLEAYDALARLKKPGQSFSRVIEAHFGSPKAVAAFRRASCTAVVSEHTLKAVDAIARGRKTPAARVPTL